jgi:hypothetical protein
MTGSVAIVREQGQTFSVVAVKDSAVQPSQREDTLTGFQREFGPRTVIMGAQRGQLYGPPDIVRFLGNVDPSRLPWRDFTITP